MRESSPPEAMRPSDRSLLTRVPGEEELGLVDSPRTEPPRLGTHREVPGTGLLPAETHPEDRGLKVESRELGHHGGLQLGHGLVAALREVRGPRDQIGPQAVHSLREPTLVLAGPCEVREVRIEPRAERQDRVHALAVLPLEPPDLVQPTLDRFEPRRIEHDAVAVRPERASSLVELDQGGVEGLDRRLDRRIEPGQLPQEGCRASRPLDRRGRILVELPVCRGGAFGQALGVHEPSTLLALLLFLPDPEPRGVDLRDGLAVLGGPGHLVAGRRAQGIELRRRAAPLVVALAEAFAEDPQPRKGVQEVEVAGRPEQGLMLVLTVDLDQGLTELFQQGQRGVRVVQKNPSAAATHQLPPDQEPVILQGDAVLLQHRAHRTAGRSVEHGLDGRGLSTRADGLGRLGPLAEEQGQGVDQDRLARACLPREDVQARTEGDRQRFNDGEVADPKLSEHPGAPCRRSAFAPF